MPLKTALNVCATDPDYDSLEKLVASRTAGVNAPVFTTDADPEALWAAYLGGIPEPSRQHYTCNCCRRFIQTYGGLVTIDPWSDEYKTGGQTEPLLWTGPSPDDWLAFFRESVVGMRRLAMKARVTGVFLTADAVLGTPAAGGWTHLHVPAPPGAKFDRKNGRWRDAEQFMAELRQDRGVLAHSLADFPLDVVREAVRVLEADALGSAATVKERAKWLLVLHERLAATDNARHRDNLIWLAAATAPVGYTHVRSDILGTLLDDVKRGLPFAEVARRWAQKTHPLQYRRPTAPPSEGQIDAAQKLVDRLGVAPAFARRYATLADVLAKKWVPAADVLAGAAPAGGVFDHLRGGTNRPVRNLVLPPTVMTWTRFAAEALPGARRLEVLVPSGPAGFYGLLTAADPSAPPIIQWDGLTAGNDDGVTTLSPLPRNPVSWYFYARGSYASQWGLTAGTWADVTAVFDPPFAWQKPEQFRHLEARAFLAVAGCREQADTASLCLFDQVLKAELHPARAVIEAHSNRGHPTGRESGDANGLAVEKGNPVNLTLRATPADGAPPREYRIDRWD